MNKKLKVMSSVLCGVLIASNLGVTSVYAKSTNVPVKGEQAVSTESIDSKESFKNCFSSDTYYDKLIELGFTENEMYDLYLKESEKLGTPLKLPNKLSENIQKDYASSMNLNRRSSRAYNKSPFPPNPQIGKTYDLTLTVTISDLAFALGVPAGSAGTIALMSKGEVAKALVKILGLGTVGAVMGAAGFIIGGIATFAHNYGVQWKQTWYYGEDNHMSIGWTPGYAYGYKWI
ncbi:hypothetical protein [Clostridium lundense]|uniref:hypothetical protein n=1 Tax=Clostridium lundense TaxID=319475 RepID=UPI000485528A|nr:hypothetical protein [Clostridium lundense]